MRGSGSPVLLSFGALVLLLVALGLGQLRGAAGPAAPLAACAGPLPFALVLPATLPPPPAPTATAVSSNTPPAGAIPATPGPAITPTPTPAATPPIASLLRADDPPAAHGLRLVDAGPLPLLPDPPCTITPEQRRGPETCLALLPPGGQLCAAGVVADGTLAAGAAAPVLALEAVRVTVTDADGATRLDVLEGYLRYDDPARRLRLFCPQIRLLQDVGPSARQFVALCQNNGAEGWAVSGQATDGAAGAADSVGLTIDAPDGEQLPLAGPLTSGAVQVHAPHPVGP
jgi:hypothetical protein